MRTHTCKLKIIIYAIIHIKEKQFMSFSLSQLNENENTYKINSFYLKQIRLILLHIFFFFLQHVGELDNVTNIMNLYQDGFVTMIQDNFEIAPEIAELHKNETLNLFSNSDSIVPANQSLTYKLHERSLNGTHLKHYLDYGSSLTFKVGIYKEEEYLYYDEKVNQNYIYVS